MTDFQSENLLQVEQFKIKRLIKKLDTSKNNGCSMITLIIPPKKQIVEITKMLQEELGKAQNIKDRVNRQSVQDAITATSQRLKLYNKTPPNGLVLYCGKIFMEDGKTEKRLLIDFEPYRGINTSVYLCDSRFHVEALRSLLQTEPPFGFIVVDGHGAIFASIEGGNKEILAKYNVELPKKHNKGGQSSVRFARLRLEKRHNYLRKVCEIATQCFILNDKCTVTGLVLAGSADFKNDVMGSQMFDPRLQCKVVKVVDVSYGGDNGLNQAIELSQEAIKGIKFIKEKQSVSRFFEEIAKDSGMIVYGVQDTMKTLETGACEHLMMFEQSEYWRVKLKNKETNQESVIYLKESELTNPKFYIDATTKQELESLEQQELTEWLAENYMKFGAELQFISDKSPEGCQFVKGFGGIGGFLRYKFEVEHLNAGIDIPDDEDDFI